MSIEVNASIKGVNITPPPTPAITETTAIIELKIKDITTKSTLERFNKTGTLPEVAKISINIRDPNVIETRMVNSGSFVKSFTI